MQWMMPVSSALSELRKDPMPGHSTPSHNHLLADLPAAEFERLANHLEQVTLPLGQVLCESGAHLQHVYFPTSAILPLQYVMQSGASAEIAGVGNEGMLGISVHGWQYHAQSRHCADRR